MKKVLFVVFILLLCIGGSSFYMNFLGGDRSALEHQLNSALATRNPDVIRQLATDEATYQYLMKLPAGTECSKTSDAQGGGNTLFYYRSKLVGQNVDQGIDCYLIRDNSMPLFPKWTLSKVSVDNPYSLPEIQNMQH